MRPALLICAVLLAAAGAAQEAPRRFKPFHMDKQCVFRSPLNRVPGVRWSERAEGKVLYQIYTETATGRELFRIDVGGWHGSQWVKYWLYGIVDTGDYNGDGRADYAWHGGDDTSTLEYIALSGAEGYRKLQVRRTLEEEWARRHPKDRRDFHLFDPGNEVCETVLENSNGELALTFRIRSLSRPNGPSRVARVAARDFVFSAK